MREYDDSWLQPLKDQTEEARRKTEILRQEVEVLRAQAARLRKQRRELQERKRVLVEKLNEETIRDAARYRWLRSRVGLSLRSCCPGNRWTREDGTPFNRSHYLDEAGTGHAAYETLDETIDAAMIVAQERDEEGHE